MENKTTRPFFIIFVLAFLFVFSPLGKAQKAAYNLIQKEDITFFKGDSLSGFPLDEELNKCNQYVQKPGVLYEYKCVLKQKEAGFVKKKYNIGKLPFEIAFEQEMQRNAKNIITESQKQAYRQNNPPPQPLASSCNNLDFENGNFTNWNGYEGYNKGSNNPLATVVGPIVPPTNLNSAETSCNYFSIMTGGTDPNTGISLTSPLGGNCARMGGENRNYGDLSDGYVCAGNNQGGFTQADISSCVAAADGVPVGTVLSTTAAVGEELETTFLVTNANSAFQYAYLFVYLDNGAHDTTQQPYFKVQVLDQSGNELSCLNYYQEGLGNGCSTHNPPGYQTDGAGLYWTNGWQVSSLNLKPYLNTNVTVRYTVAGCTRGGHFGYAYVDGACSPQQIIIPNAACQGQNATLIAPPIGNAVYQWNTPNGNIVSGATSQTVTVNQSGTYSVTITPTRAVLDASGNVLTQTLTACSYKLDTTITIYPNPTVSVNSATLCTGTTATLNVTSTGSAAPLTFTWSSTAGLTFTSGDTVATANPPATTTYTITGTSIHGCKDTAVSHVTVNIEPPPTFTAPAVCLGTATAFFNSVTVGDVYQWNFGDTHTLADTSRIANPSYTYTYTGNFSVSFSVTTAGGCKSNVTQTVTVNPAPTATISVKPVCLGLNSVFTSTVNNGSTYVWDFADGGVGTGTNITTATPSYSYVATGTYTPVSLTVTSVNNCSVVATTSAVVNPIPVLSFSTAPACDLSPVKITNTTPAQNTFSHWLWTMGDGVGTSIAAAPGSYTYPAPGIYTVVLTATTTAGCSSTFSTTSTVHPNPTFNGTFDQPCLGNLSSIYDLSTLTNPAGINDALTTWNWNFGDGFTTTTAVDSANHTYATCGTYNISYTVSTNFNCAASGGGPDTVFCLPTVVAPLNFSVCPGTNTPQQTFTATCANGGIPTAVWFQSLANVNNTGAPASFINPGGNNVVPSYNAIAKNMSCNILQDSVFAVAISGAGCVGNATYYTASVFPTPYLLHMPTDSICANQTIVIPSFTACPANSTIAWTNTNTAIGLGANGSGNIGSFVGLNTTTNLNTGLINAVPTANGCVGNDSTFTIVIKPLPIVTPVPDEIYCPNQVVPQINFTCSPPGGVPVFSYSGLGGIGITQTGSIPSFTTMNTGQLPIVNTITVSATLNNCKGPGTSFNITVNPNPIANFSYTPVCEGKPTSFTDQSTVGGGIMITSWHWDMNNDLQTDITFQNPQYTITPAGTHTVNLTVFTNSVPSCTAITTQTIVVNPNPVVNFVGVDLKGCPNLNTAFTDQSVVATGNITSWSWNFGNGTTSSSHYPQPQVYTNGSALAPLYYTVGLTVTSDQGCVGSNIKNNYIEVYPRPIADFAWNPTNADITDPVITFVNQAVGYSSYPSNNPSVFGSYGVQYYLGDTYAGNSTPNYVYNPGNFNHTYSDPDPKDVTETYNVTQWVVNSYGCRDSVMKPVEILPIFNFYIPNAFSPNADGKNEGFKGTGIGIDNTTYNLWVFDRWGLMIYHAQDLEKAWDGHMLGHEERPILQEDVYVWKVNFNDVFGKLHEYHGTVTLLK
jgi:gliding motility-associated-like protein